MEVYFGYFMQPTIYCNDFIKQLFEKELGISGIVSSAIVHSFLISHLL